MKRIAIKFPRHRAAEKTVRNHLPGRRWDPSNRCFWIAPERIFEAADLIEPFFPEYSQVLREAKRFEPARNLAKERALSVDLSSATTSDIDIPAPEGETYRPFQKAGVEYMAHAIERGQRGVILADEMGLGKTIQTIALANYKHFKKVLIVCPASVKINWYREYKKWDTQRLRIGIIDALTAAKTFRVLDVTIVSYNLLGRFINAILREEWELLVGDEAHFIKTTESQRTQFFTDIAQRGCLTWGYDEEWKTFTAMLTGTPIVNRPKELWPLISLADPEQFQVYAAFGKKFCGGVKDKHGWNFDGNSNLDELQDILRASIMIRRMKKDVLAELPAKTRQIIEIQPEGEMIALVREEHAHRSRVETVLEELGRIADEATNDEEYRIAVKKMRQFRVGEFSELAKIRHKTALAKVPKVVKFAKEVLQEKDKLVIFAHHRDVIGKLKEAFGPCAVTLMGGKTTKERQQAIDAFQNNPNIKVFIGSIMAAGVGITLTAADTVIFAELDWVPGNLSQAEDRVHRIGQRGSVMIYHLVLRNSIDYMIAKKNVEKQEVIDRGINRKA